MSLLLALTSYTPVNYTLVCDSGAYSLSGGEANFSISRGQTVSGGYFGGYVKRRTTVEEDRKRLGIVTGEAKKIIKKVAKSTVNIKKDDDAAKILLAELKRNDLQLRQNYEDMFFVYRDKAIASMIEKGLLEKTKRKKQQEEEDEEDFMLLM